MCSRCILSVTCTAGRVTGLVWQSLAALQWLQQVCLLAGAAPSLSAVGQRKVLACWAGAAWWPCCSRCRSGPCTAAAPRYPVVSTRPGAAAIEGLCVSRHKVRIDAVSPPPAVPSRAANGSHKGALLPLLRTGCQRADRRHHTAAGAPTPSVLVPGTPLSSALPRLTWQLLRFLPGQLSLPAAGTAW